MNETQAIGLAADSARREGYDTSRYDVEAEKWEDRWEVHFRRKGEDKPGPGDFFTVHVDDGSGTVTGMVHGK